MCSQIVGDFAYLFTFWRKGQFKICLFLLKILHREAYDVIENSTQKQAHAKTLGVKGTYPVMRLPYHNRIDATFVDGMHTLKDIVCNVMDAVLKKKTIRVPSLELSSNSLAIADARFNSLVIPNWIDLPSQVKMISNPKSLKTHDWMQVSITAAKSGISNYK